jgi:hypothetical protein
MKKMTIIVIALFFSTFAKAQTSYEIFEDIPITFYGLDFTHAKCVGSRKIPEANVIVNKYFKEWNDLFMVGRKRIDIGHPYKKHEVYYDTSVYQKNRNIDPSKLVVEIPYDFKRKEVEAYMEDYADPSKEGVGLIYMVESINTADKYLSIWVTFFNMKTGDIILTEPLRSKGHGRKFSFYWNDALVSLYEESAKDYKVWRKAFR